MKKHIVVTGATSGVGEECIKRFSKDLDWKVFGIARSRDKLKELEGKYSQNFKGLECNLQNSKDVKETFEKIKEYTLSIDVLVNNAGIFKMREFTDCTIEDIDSIIDTNLKGVLYTTFEALKIMKASKENRISRIINIASVASIHGIPKQSIYCASKFGLNGFAEALNQEVIKDNIMISTISPGGINTPLWNSNTNPYPPGDVGQALDTTDIVDLIEYISNLKDKIVLKNMTLFPSNEWH